MNLNTAVLKGVFVHFLLRYNESNQTVRAAENQWQDSFQRSLIYRPRFFFFFIPEKHFVEMESVIKAKGGTSARDAPGELCEEPQFPSVGSISLADWLVFHLLV